jgi:rhodanese-related sulfurtransferase
MLKQILFFFFTIVSLISCSQSKNNTISVDAFEQGILQNNIQLLDVRTAGEYKTGYLKNALQANYNNSKEFADRVQHLDKNRPVYIYCLSGVRSENAMQTLKELGFVNVYHLKGGINAWKQKNKPIEGYTSNAQMTEEEYQQKTNTNGLVLVDFGANWCPPCIRMKPIITDVLKAMPQVTLVNIDGGNDLKLMEKYQVEALPVFIIYKNGKQIWRKQGIVSADELTKQLSK